MGIVCGFLLMAQQAAHANADAPGVDFYDPDSTGGSYVRGPTATCVTGAPDYDDPEDCTDGDNVTFMYRYDTSSNNEFGSPYLDMVIYNGQRSPGDHFYCNERLDCSDGSRVEGYARDASCYAVSCPPGTTIVHGFFNYGVNSNVDP